MSTPDVDFEALSQRPQWYLSLHASEFALMRRREVIDLYPSFRDASREGLLRFGREGFSVQRVAAVIEYLRLVSTEPHGQVAPPDADYKALVSLPEEYLRENEDKYALMHRQEVVGFFETFKEATKQGRNRFAKDEFTVQKVHTQPLRSRVLAHLYPG